MKKLKLLVGFLCLFTGYVAAAPADESDVAAAVDKLTQAMLHNAQEYKSTRVLGDKEY